MTFGPYTDPIPADGWGEDTVAYMIDHALADLDKTLNDSVTRDSCYSWLTECLREITGKQLHWPDLYRFNESLKDANSRGQIDAEILNGSTLSLPTTLARGIARYPLPLDMYDRKSNKSILAVRLGLKATKLSYLDPMEFERKLLNVAVTRLNDGGASAHTTSIFVADTADFEVSGTLDIYTSGTLQSVTYTGKTATSFTGIPASGTGSVTASISNGAYVWQGEHEGTPLYFTVREEGFLEIGSQLPDDLLHGKNLYLDYATKATRVDSDGDTIDIQRFDILQAYLTWRMKMKFANSGSLDTEDGWYLKYKEKLNDAIRTLPRGVNFSHHPRVNRMRKR